MSEGQQQRRNLRQFCLPNPGSST